MASTTGRRMFRRDSSAISGNLRMRPGRIPGLIALAKRSIACRCRRSCRDPAADSWLRLARFVGILASAGAARGHGREEIAMFTPFYSTIVVAGVGFAIAGLPAYAA